jgi:hypothetical protein
MSEPDIINESAPLRETHAIRLMIHEETKDMTQKERAALTRKEAQEMIDKYGLQLNRHARQEEMEDF